MIKHIVMWKMKNYDYLPQKKHENMCIIKGSLESLKDMIPEIQKIEVGINKTDSDRAFDVVLYSEFNSMDDLNVYSTHTEHLKVVNFIKSVTTESKCVDYEL